MKKISNAIILHGPGRSGTTLLSNILSLHKDFYWISGYVNKYPGSPSLSLFNNLQRFSAFEKLNRGKRKFPRPAEAYDFWNHHFKYFNKKEEIITDLEVENTINTINCINKFTLGERFVTKLTGKSRFNYINAVFENPTIVWIDRKPEAVVMSYYKQRWLYKNKPEVFNQIDNTTLINEYCNLYKSFSEDKNRLKQFNFIQVYYEDLVKEPINFFSELCKNLKLPFNTDFKQLILSQEIHSNTNESYKKGISEKEHLLLENLLEPFSKDLGYH